MASFRYKAKTAPGSVVEGILEADSRLVALDKLVGQGYFPMEVRPNEKPTTVSKIPWVTPYSRKALTLFTRQLADLLESGVSLPQALGLIAEESENAAWAQLIQRILSDVQGGKPFSQTLKEYPEIFSPLYISLVYAGETGGTLAVTLGRLADFIEQEDDFRSRLYAALAYPFMIVLVGIGAIIFLMTFAVPQLAAMFTDLGRPMPLATRCLMCLSDWTISAGRWLPVALVLVVFLLSQSKVRKKIKNMWGQLMLHMPVWGSVLRKSIIARFARTLATLLAGGVPIIEALHVVSDVLDHPAMKKRILHVTAEVAQGHGLSESLRGAPEFPGFIRHMISVGEAVNTLEKSLNKVAGAYERETERAMKLATSILEPVMIILIGSVVGVIVIAMLLPIFQMSAFVR